MSPGFTVLENNIGSTFDKFWGFVGSTIVPWENFLTVDDGYYSNAWAYPFIGWLLTACPLTRITGSGSVSPWKLSTCEIWPAVRGKIFIDILRQEYDIEAFGMDMTGVSIAHPSIIKTWLWEDMPICFPGKAFDAIYHHLLWPQDERNAEKFDTIMNALHTGWIYISARRTTSPHPDPIQDLCAQKCLAIGSILIQDNAVLNPQKAPRYYSIFIARKRS